MTEDQAITHDFRPWRAGLVLASAVILAVYLASAGHAAAGPCVPGRSTVPVIADTRISHKKPATNFGRSETWAVGPNPTGTGSLDTSFVRFPLATVPPGCTVTDAELLASGYQRKPHVRDDQVVIYRNTSSWQERALTYDNNRTTQDNPHAVFDGAWPGPWNVTRLVQRMYRAGTPNYGLMIYGGNVRGGKVVGDSRESDNPPVVRISWG